MSKTDSLTAIAPLGRSLVAVIDVQNDFVSRHGALHANVESSAHLQALVVHLAEFLGRVRELGVRIAFTRHEYEPAVLTAAERRLHDLRFDSPGFPRPGSWGAMLCPSITPALEEPVIVKHHYSAFTAPAFVDLLETSQVESLVLTGALTNVCVESTARDAEAHGYKVLLVDQCVASNDADLHKATLRNVALYFGWVCTADELLDSWQLAGSKSYN